MSPPSRWLAHSRRATSSSGVRWPTFDAAYLVTALGEIPDPRRAVRELRRVLKPAGRLVVGEFFDRHYVPLVDLLGYANAAGFQLSARLGPPLAYLVCLRPC